MTNPYLRQLDIFDPNDFNHYGVNIIGCGSIGSVLGVALSKLGIKLFTLWDDDKIENINIANQGFSHQDFGGHKSRTLSSHIYNGSPDRDNMKAINIDSKLTDNCRLHYPIVFSCTDSISSRKIIYKVALKSGCKLLIDGRMQGKIFKIFTVDLTDKECRDEYENSFHKDTEQSCTNRSIIYNTYAVSAFMANQLTKVFQNKPYAFEINVCLENLLIKTRYLKRRKK